MTSTPSDKVRSPKYFTGYSPGDRGLRIQSRSYVEDTRRKRNPAYDYVAQLQEDENRSRRRAATRLARKEEEAKIEAERQQEEDRKLKELTAQFGSQFDLSEAYSCK